MIMEERNAPEFFSSLFEYFIRFRETDSNELILSFFRVGMQKREL